MTSAAARSKRYRRRLRDNRAVLAVEVDLFGLIGCLLGEEASEDRAQVAAAVGRMIETWAKIPSCVTQPGPASGLRWRMFTKTRLRTVEATPVSMSAIDIVADIPKSNALVEAEERLAGLRAEREQLLDEIRGLSGRRNDRDIQHQIVALHLRREDIEKQIVSARKCRATALEPH